jgi:transglutaminase-like putative cysteine protease
MRDYGRALLLALLMLMSSATAMAEGPGHRPRLPAFVVPVAIPAANPARQRAVEGGVDELLDDTQILTADRDETVYRRRVRKAIGRNGLEGAAKTSIDFDPAVERLVIHNIRIVRAGRTIDAFPDTRIETIRRESDMDDDIWTGVMTTVVNVPGLKVGDIVDVDWSWESVKRNWPGHSFGSYELGWSVPVALTHVRLINAGSRPIRFRALRGAKPPSVVHEGPRSIYEWRVVDPDPIPGDGGTPDWYSSWPSVQVSTMASWAEVVAWALPLYADPGEIPPELDRRVMAIAASTADPSQRALAALRMVQDEIRYTSLSIGSGAYHPRPVATIWRSGFGDCKDKAQILSVILRRMGIAAWPALTDIDHGAALAGHIPSPSVFDHVITRIEIGGRVHWVDPTGSLEGGSLSTLADLPYRWALPIRAGQTALAPIAWRPSRQPTKFVKESYRIGPDGMTLGLRVVMTMDEADIQRRRIASKSLAAVEQNYLDYYRDRYPGLESVGPMRVGDDRRRNVVILRAGYRLPLAALDKGDLRTRFPIAGWTLDDLYKTPANGPRHDPFGLPFPVNRIHQIEITHPGGHVGVPAESHRDGPGLRYRLDVERHGDTLLIDYRMFGKRPEIPARDVAAHRADVVALNDAVSWYVNLDAEPATDTTAVIYLLLCLAALVLFCLAVIRARRRTQLVAEGQHFYPVLIGKFVILSLTTLGFYAAYWQYRCWKRYAATDQQRIMPFWRSVFGIFWVKSLFDRANDRALPPVPGWVGLLGAIGYFLWEVVTNAGTRIGGHDSAWLLAGLLAPLFLLPMVIAVNRANDADAVIANGRGSWLAYATAATGTAITAMFLFTDVGAR